MNADPMNERRAVRIPYYSRRLGQDLAGPPVSPFTRERSTQIAIVQPVSSEVLKMKQQKER